MEFYDWLVLGLYAVGTLVMGWWVSRRQEDTKEYFVGSGKMNPVLVGVSLFATLLSTITYLAIPGEVVGKGPIYLTNYLTYPLVFWVVGYWVLPRYMAQRVTSAYELLEGRLGLSVRMLAVGMFLALRLVWMSLLILLTSKALAVMMGQGAEAVPWIAAVTGLFAITYTSMGGLRAVVVTDLMQTLLLYGGALLVLGAVTVKMSGLGWLSEMSRAGLWDHQPVFSLDPGVRVTVVGSMISVFLWTVCTSMGDQVSVQRFMATADVKAARRAIAVQLGVATVVGITLGLVGVALLGYYQAHPELLPEAGGVKAQADTVFSHFIAQGLPEVVTGLVVSGLFAAAMSSVDSGVNSITAVVMTDLMDRFGKKPSSEREHVRFARWLAFGIGCVVVLLSGVMGKISGNFLAVTNKTVNLLTVPIALLFYYAVFARRACAGGAWMAALGSVAAAVLVAFSGEIFGVDPVTKLPPVSFQWIPLVALGVGLAMGELGNRIFGGKEKARS